MTALGTRAHDPGEPHATLPPEGIVPRPPVPEGPYLVAGCGRAGRAAARALVARAGAGEVAVWEEERSPPAPDALPVGIAVRRDADPERLVRELRPRTLVRSPGIPIDAPVVRAALDAGALVIDELDLGWRLVRRPIVAITGTNGKSTTAALVRAALGGERAPLAGNAEHGVPLSDLTGTAGGWVVCEVSSFQLEAGAMRPEVGVVLNLSPDHLERHGTMEAYGAVKARLLLRDGVPAPVSVVDVGCAYGRGLADACERAGGRVVRVGSHPSADHRVTGATWSLTAAVAMISARGAAMSVRTRLPGAHNARNIAAALAVAEVLGVDPAFARDSIGRFPGVPGRFEVIDEGQAFDAVVDFAHNADGVEQALGAARDLVIRRPGARLLSVLSAAGGRDPSGPPAMGRAAARLADVLVLTTGASRGDPHPLAPLRALAAGARTVAGARPAVIPDRRAAIAEGIARARPGDLLVVAGRGARSRLVVDRAGNGPEFDDRVVTRELLRAAAC